MTESEIVDSGETFLQYFAEIEDHLRKIVNDREHLDFSPLLARAGEHSLAVKRSEAFLLSAAALRNAIVHLPRRRNEIIADPRRSAVEQLRRVRDLIAQPPSLCPEFCALPVEMCEAADPIAGPLETMYHNRFSQMPVYRSGELHALLTTETIARWLFQQSSADVDLASTSVADVLPHAESDSNYEVLSHSATVYDALEAFDEFGHRGAYLDAILVTKGGKRDETPEGILTVFDLKDLYESVEVGEL